MNYAELFAKANKKAVDIPEFEYLQAHDEVDSAAAEAGYRLAGIRLNRAVFTTKPPRDASRDPQGGT